MLCRAQTCCSPTRIEDFRTWRRALRWWCPLLPPHDARRHRAKSLSWPFAGGNSASANLDLLAIVAGGIEGSLFICIFSRTPLSKAGPLRFRLSKTRRMRSRAWPQQPHHRSRYSKQLFAYAGAVHGPRSRSSDPAVCITGKAQGHGPLPTNGKAPRSNQRASRPLGPPCHHPSVMNGLWGEDAPQHLQLAFPVIRRSQGGHGPAPNPACPAQSRPLPSRRSTVLALPAS